MTRALVVIDGEHYPPVVRDAIVELPYEVIGAWLAGGTEKLRGEIEYGVPLLAALDDGFSDAEVEQMAAQGAIEMPDSIKASKS